MVAALVRGLRRLGRRLVQAVCRGLEAATKPSSTRLVVDTLADLPRNKVELIAENALLRQQLLVSRRSVKRVHCSPTDGTLLVLLASRVRAWRHAVLIVQPDTPLRWHRQGFRLVWRRKSKVTQPTARPKVSQETIALIRAMAAANRLWGAERIRGELLKLGITVAKTTVQRYMRQARPGRGSGQTWATFLRTHAAGIWAGDFLPVTDLLFRQLYAFFISELATRRVVHVGVTRHPTDAWVAQQLREATPYAQHPTYLSRDNDSKYGPDFARVAESSGITIVHTAYRLIISMGYLLGCCTDLRCCAPGYGIPLCLSQSLILFLDDYSSTRLPRRVSPRRLSLPRARSPVMQSSPEAGGYEQEDHTREAYGGYLLKHISYTWSAAELTVPACPSGAEQGQDAAGHQQSEQPESPAARRWSHCGRQRGHPDAGCNGGRPPAQRPVGGHPPWRWRRAPSSDIHEEQQRKNESSKARQPLQHHLILPSG
jgi:hypothetical protein